LQPIDKFSPKAIDALLGSLYRMNTTDVFSIINDFKDIVCPNYKTITYKDKPWRKDLYSDLQMSFIIGETGDFRIETDVNYEVEDIEAVHKDKDGTLYRELYRVVTFEDYPSEFHVTSYGAKEVHHMFNIKNMTSMEKMFFSCSALEKIDLSNIDISNIEDTYYMFNNCWSLKEINLSNWNAEKLKNTSGMFLGCESLTSLIGLNTWTNFKPNLLDDMFYNCYSIEEINVSGWDTSEVVSLYGTFSDCHALTTIHGIENWDVSKVTNMQYVFYACYALESLDINNWKPEANKDVEAMFYDCVALKSLKIANLVNESTWSLYNMFTYCGELEYLDISNWNVTDYYSCDEIFLGCSSLELDNIIMTNCNDNTKQIIEQKLNER
jgi:surface protein